MLKINQLNHKSYDMIIESILLLTAFIGSVLAGIIDLKTTEIPDRIPYAMIGIGIFGNLIKSYLVWSYIPIALSFLVGLLFLGFGFILYYTGQWGGGDAKILSAVGFLLPQFSSAKTFFPFPVSFFFNVFFIGAFYMIGYIVVMTMMNRKIISCFVDDIKSRIKELIFLNVCVIIFLVIFGLFTIKHLQIITLHEMFAFGLVVIAMTFGMFSLWRFGKTVEEVGFKKRIKVPELKEGDVLEDSKVWEGLTKKQVKKLQESKKKYVVIKEGVRFAPTFPLALLTTVLFGDIIFLVVGLV